MTSLNITQKDGYAIIQIDNGKVNAIDLALAKDLHQVFSEMEADKDVRGVILAGRPHAFSAGLNMMSLAFADEEDVYAFWYAFLQSLQTMIRFSKPFVCAITGYAPAGATTLAQCADYRVMARGEKHVVGLHEFKMSMPIPELMGDIYAYHLGEARAWKAIQEASLFNSDQALELGLVDESVEVEMVMPQAEKHLQKMIRINPFTFQGSKAFMRKQLLKLVDRPLEPMAEELTKGWQNPSVRESVGQFLASLKK
ncbi:MAG: enoyl-CoA hydratase/isomerase family protein [Bacteroidota bacterium]